MSTYRRAGRACLLLCSAVGATLLAHGGHARPNPGRHPWVVQVDRLPQAPGCRHGPDVYLETLKRWGGDALPRIVDCAHTAACSGPPRPRNRTTRQSETFRLNAARMHRAVRTNRSANQIIRSHVGAHTSPLIFSARVPSPDDRVLRYTQTRRAAAERPCPGVNIDDGHRSPAAPG
jgi:hypothetical protein